MKSKLLLLPLILLSLSLIALPAQAVKPELIAVTTTIEELQLPHPEEPGEVLATMLTHANIVFNGEYAFAHLTAHFLQRIVDEEGNLLAIFNQQVTYSGIVDSDMSFYTGTATLKWQVHIFEGGEWVAESVPMVDLKGAWSFRFLEGFMEHENGFGDYESWFTPRIFP